MDLNKWIFYFQFLLISTSKANLHLTSKSWLVYIVKSYKQVFNPPVYVFDNETCPRKSENSFINAIISLTLILKPVQFLMKDAMGF